jgi:hypothetical protein
MTFIRLKTRKCKNGKESHYAYLVENTWLTGRQRPKQKTKEYLGKALKPEKKTVDFFRFAKVTETSYFEKAYKEALLDLIKWELHQHRVEGVGIDLDSCEVRNGDNRVVLAMNQGYLCDHTLKQLLSVKKNPQESQPGYELASALVGAGLQTPKEVFVTLYEKLNGMGPR